MLFPQSHAYHRNGSGPAAGPPVYDHVGVYAYRRSLLLDIYSRPPSALEVCEGLEQLRVLEAGHAIRSLVGPTRYLGLNTPQDLERARRLLEGTAN